MRGLAGRRSENKRDNPEAPLSGFINPRRHRRFAPPRLPLASQPLASGVPRHLDTDRAILSGRDCLSYQAGASNLGANGGFGYPYAPAPFFPASIAMCDD